jgi:transcription elongation factor GreB
MSRAFVKESDGDQPGEDLPERPQSPHTNYVTPLGLQQLQDRLRELGAERAALAGTEDMADRQQLRRVERDMNFLAERLRRAVVVRPETQSDDRVHFGSTVEVVDDRSERHRFAIVGEDEADAAQGKISWVSPLARALLNARVGDAVTWRRPAGDKELEVVAIRKA